MNKNKKIFIPTIEKMLKLLIETRSETKILALSKSIA